MAMAFHVAFVFLFCYGSYNTFRDAQKSHKDAASR